MSLLHILVFVFGKHIWGEKVHLWTYSVSLSADMPILEFFLSPIWVLAPKIQYRSGPTSNSKPFMLFSYIVMALWDEWRNWIDSMRWNRNNLDSCLEENLIFCCLDFACRKVHKIALIDKLRANHMQDVSTHVNYLPCLFLTDGSKTRRSNCDCWLKASSVNLVNLPQPLSVTSKSDVSPLPIRTLSRNRAL